MIYRRKAGDDEEYELDVMPEKGSLPVLIIPSGFRNGKPTGFAAVFVLSEADKALQELIRLGQKELHQMSMLSKGLLARAAALRRYEAFMSRTGKPENQQVCIVLPVVIRNSDRIQPIALGDLLRTPAVLSRIDWKHTIDSLDRNMLRALKEGKGGVVAFPTLKAYQEEKGGKAITKRYSVPLPPDLTSAIICTKTERDIIYSEIEHRFGKEARRMSEMLTRESGKNHDRANKKGAREKRLERSHSRERKPCGA